ncbi:hypothetical protein KYK29_19835 [Shinella daejeonensis]|uniref:plant virulence effector HPE1-like domain-containing protein n=1 Tax=Shinella daejeonensis TaxID=659017 RepID=UPI0020C7A1D5|nr:plant virulence effector HPE1-like domain-containing protein [Shinella daejeonensis]MCP8897183.1 hypothetical protein [Shinella daejeonensis]
MRRLTTAFALVLLAAPAVASSIEPVTGGQPASDSISIMTCAACPALKKKPASELYHVEPLAAGTQKVEIREENGVRKIYRTEAWMGGSPVVFVSTLPEEPATAAAADPIDREAHTSALDAALPQDAAALVTGRSQEFDPGGFDLRVN